MDLLDSANIFDYDLREIGTTSDLKAICGLKESSSWTPGPSSLLHLGFSSLQRKIPWDLHDWLAL